MSGTCRESHQGKPGCYCSVKEHRSQLHQAVDVCPCYFGECCRRGLSSTQFQTPAAQILGRIKTACLGSVSPRLSPRSDVQFVERGRPHSHIASMLFSGCHLYRC